MVRGPFGPTVAVPHKLVADLLPLLGKQWEAGDLSPDLMKAALRLARQARRRQWLGLGRDELEKGLNGPGSPIYLLVSHRLAHWPRPIVALKKRGARFVALVHDLIPTNYPEYAPTNGALDHVARVNTFATLADGIIVNSAATAAELASPYWQRRLELMPPGPIQTSQDPLGLTSSALAQSNPARTICCCCIFGGIWPSAWAWKRPSS